jgi:2-keto-3-deoxy-L-rhamnonate aldolase
LTRQVRNKAHKTLKTTHLSYHDSPGSAKEINVKRATQKFPTLTVTMTLSPPTGVFVPVPTFFKPKSASSSLQPAVDVQTQIEHSIFLAKNGVRGLVLLGSTGEAIHMSRQERIDVVSGVRKGLEDAGFKDYPIMAGTLINSVDETLEWLDDFKKAGAQWGLVLAPGYFGAAASQEGIREWFTIVADKSPLPILMQVTKTRNWKTD